MQPTSTHSCERAAQPSVQILQQLQNAAVQSHLDIEAVLRMLDKNLRSKEEVAADAEKRATGLEAALKKAQDVKTAADAALKSASDALDEAITAKIAAKDALRTAKSGDAADTPEKKKAQVEEVKVLSAKYKQARKTHTKATIKKETAEKNQLAAKQAVEQADVAAKAARATAEQAKKPAEEEAATKAKRQAVLSAKKELAAIEPDKLGFDFKIRSCVYAQRPCAPLWHPSLLPSPVLHSTDAVQVPRTGEVLGACVRHAQDDQQLLRHGSRGGRVRVGARRQL
jgi:hypothetical protein